MKRNQFYLAFSAGMLTLWFCIVGFLSVPHYHDMSHADQVTVNVDEFIRTENAVYLDGVEVESDVDVNLLFSQKEEITLRVDGMRYGIIKGDNLNF